MRRHSLCAIVFCALAVSSLWAWRSNHSLAGQLASARSHLEDWPDLRRYEGKAAEPNSVVVIGDSITEGWPLPAGYVNRGISGQTTAQMLVRFRGEVLGLRPATVVIEGGTNDIGGLGGYAPDWSIESNLAGMAELARAHGVRVVLTTIPPGEGRDAVRVGVVNEWIRAYAAREGHGCLDLFAVLSDADGRLRPTLTDDGLHPNRAGYEALLPPLREAMGVHPVR